MSLVENLIREYSDFKLDIPKWEISDKGITVLWGPSGAGKTTVFRILIGLEHCPQLKWTFKRKDLAKVPTPNRKLGVVFQSLELFPHMSARENIEFAARARGIKRSDKKLKELADQLKLEDQLDRSVQVLSGGEKQRVALARAIIGEPRFLFLDEPFSSLDAEVKEEARKLVKKVIKERDIPTLLITHDPEDVKILGNHKVEIRKGKLL